MGSAIDKNKEQVDSLETVQAIEAIRIAENVPMSFIAERVIGVTVVTYIGWAKQRRVPLLFLVPLINRAYEFMLLLKNSDSLPLLHQRRGKPLLWADFAKSISWELYVPGHRMGAY